MNEFEQVEVERVFLIPLRDRRTFPPPVTSQRRSAMRFEGKSAEGEAGAESSKTPRPSHQEEAASVRRALRDAIQTEHARAEALPFMAALQGGRLTRESYVGFLRALLAVRTSLEATLTRSDEGRVELLRQCVPRRAVAIQADLSHLDPEGDLTAPVAAVRAQLLAQRIRLQATADPLCLVGVAYVMEGSMAGAALVAPQVADSLEVSPEGGLAYLSGRTDGGPTGPDRDGWTEFTAELDRIDLTSGELDRVARAARGTMADMSRVFSALHPLIRTPFKDLARELNPSAGSHVISSTEEELAAALRAGERSWAEFPYYATRFGDRGRAFTRSDSAWLVTLAYLDSASAVENVMWLSNLLAARGMPRWLMERHLVVLLEELDSRGPEAAEGQYGNLHEALATLRELRDHCLSDQHLLHMKREFAAKVPVSELEGVPWAGALLAAAVADEAAGLTMAVPSLVRWLADEALFSRDWIDQVERTLERARALMAVSLLSDPPRSDG
jgi:heme oxygenase